MKGEVLDIITPRFSAGFRFLKDIEEGECDFCSDLKLQMVDFKMFYDQLQFNTKIDLKVFDL